jgi:hypothetical protein
MSELIQLVKLQKDLQQGVEALVHGLETHTDSPTYSAYFQIANRCMRLERDIDLLTRELLELEQPRGAA